MSTLLVTKYVILNEGNLRLNGINSLIDLSSLQMFYFIKSHDYKVIINA